VLSQVQFRPLEARKSEVVATRSCDSDCCQRTRNASTRICRMMALLVAVACFGDLQFAALAQGTEQRQNHTVRATLAVDATNGELNLIFTVSPAIRVLPIVHSLRVPQDGSKTLTVGSKDGGNYSALVGQIKNLDNGQLLIELSDAASGLQEFHGVDFAVGEIATSGPSSSPSRDGHFVVYTKPDRVARSSRLVISSSEQPISALPAGVSARLVLAAYSLDFVPAVGTTEGWRLAIAITPSDGKPALFYLAKGGKAWKPLESSLIEGHPLLSAAVAGPGTYLLVQGAKR